MITTFFFYLIGMAIEWSLFLLPTATLPDGIIQIFNYFIQWSNKINVLLPVDTVLQVAGIIIVMEIIYGSWKVTSWFYNKIRGSG